ncbi:F-box protein SKIP23-like [Actinidia eriantha]|uniref:F-box protein SKIP23-like n=1 Tax=Actinidia eriantha TaxID=165200 RepID=UPI0025861EA9|nr:F-box protein SKIP23-like [Actinidia eriantha]
MAGWHQLPRELIALISKHLGTDIDVLRFRSVCSSWRSSVAPNPHPTPFRLPILPNEGTSDTSWGFYLSKRTIFQLGLPEPYRQTPPFSDGWLIKIAQDVPHRTRLLNPLFRSHTKPLPESFPRRVDLLNYRISELGHEYILQYINYGPFANSIREAGKLYMMKKVALCSRACSVSGMDSFVLLTIHVSGKLAMFTFWDRKWTIIDDLPSPYDDVILFDGQFYAVDNTGRTVVVNVDSSSIVNLVANSVFDGDKKGLVESCGELLLVDAYLSSGPEDDFGFDEGFEYYEEFDCYMSERTVRFKVFRLDRSEEKWVEVDNLGERMLFLGDNCTFSASASDFPGCKGNCIFFTERYFYSGRGQEGVLNGRGLGLFDLERGSIGSLTNYPDYSKTFWPPPSWVSSTMLEVGLNQLGI